MINSCMLAPWLELQRRPVWCVGCANYTQWDPQSPTTTHPCLCLPRAAHELVNKHINTLVVEAGAMDNFLERCRAASAEDFQMGRVRRVRVRVRVRVGLKRGCQQRGGLCDLSVKGHAGVCQLRMQPPLGMGGKAWGASATTRPCHSATPLHATPPHLSTPLHQPPSSRPHPPLCSCRCA